METPARPGPIPLPLHLMAQSATLLTSLAALPLWNSGSLPWRPELAALAAELRQSLDAAGPEALQPFALAVLGEALARQRAFLAGVEAYRRHPYRREPSHAAEVWRQGTTSLRGYGGDGEPVLVVPSLINRAAILDLTPATSLMQALAADGHAAFLLDWDAPAEETAFTLTDYVLRLEAAFDAIIARTGRKPAVIGYCMGGLLALALAQRRPDSVRAMVLVATPWDFQAGRGAQARLLAALAKPLGAAIDAMGVLPVAWLQALFMANDPLLAARKFTAFAGFDPDGAKACGFVALEEWSNDGVALAGPVARECLFGWYGANDPIKGHWCVGGRPVLPGEVVAPVLAVVPAEDRIVPPEQSLPLTRQLPNCQVIGAKGGHVGMLLTQRAKAEVHRPISAWLRR